MAAGVPTIPRLFLGEALKRLRAETNATLDEAANAIGKDRTRLIRVLDGRATLTNDELAKLVDFLGAKPRQKKELLALGIEARKRPARRPYTDLLPGAYRRVADIEAMATEIKSYERSVLPGLLQTPTYIEAQMALCDGIWWDSSKEEQTNRIAFRQMRQRLALEADPPKNMHFIITEDALHAEVGSREVMIGQLAHLLHVIDRYPNITVQLLSATARNNPARLGGLIVLHFGELLRPVGFLPVMYGPATYFNEAADTEKLIRAFDRVQELAMSPEESRKVIAETLGRH